VGCAKTVERIDVLFGVETIGGPRNIVLDHPRRGDGFDAAFAKLFWPLVILVNLFTHSYLIEVDILGVAKTMI